MTTLQSKILELYQQGKNYLQIQQELNCSSATIASVVEQNRTAA